MNITEQIKQELSGLSGDDLVNMINQMREAIHEASPFKNEPVDFVKWVKNTRVRANDYNPNSVAPPEMELLRVSIEADGYTQPIVSMPDGEVFEVVDGFHRHRVGKECASITERVQGYLPLVQIREEQFDKTRRMASTIRHNRARGKHKVNAMSDIVVELKRRNWSNERISRELGMDMDEILRLCQITGLQELFSDQEFSKAWEAEGAISVDDFEEITDDITQYAEEVADCRTVNTNDEKRVFHTYDKWECQKAGFYKSMPPEGMTRDEAKNAYRDFLSNPEAFERGLVNVLANWKNSCEHYLTNSAMNRIAWLGQAAMCIETGVPAEFRGGFTLMTEEQQQVANQLALKYLNKWLAENGHEEVGIEAALADGRQSEIY
ncbi:ParB/Sulfiredoxin [uncultured Caudovirales phage]|uniref:ParB/Sulfiredoxin n=1 Tax=uncultured Caudovirales phage TaxID=2100421 RepID=A0A6J5NZH5_9CAUD|nr:ParB/Sulfiredoxin [uncultured Caudovirales phage]